MEQIKTNPTRGRRSHQQVVELLKEFENSKATVKDFCRQYQISPGSFHKWKSRYRSKADDKNHTLGLAAIAVVPSADMDSPLLFAEVSGIKIYQPVSASFLKELLA